MKRKRFIKLIMGQIGASRNEAREEAVIAQCYQANLENANREAKRSGLFMRIPSSGYAGRWRYYLEAMAYFREVELRVKQGDAKHEG